MTRLFVQTSLLRSATLLTATIPLSFFTWSFCACESLQIRPQINKTPLCTPASEYLFHFFMGCVRCCARCAHKRSGKSETSGLMRGQRAIFRHASFSTQQKPPSQEPQLEPQWLLWSAIYFVFQITLLLVPWCSVQAAGTVARAARPNEVPASLSMQRSPSLRAAALES